MTKTAGIVCDDYKLDQFTDALTKHEFENFIVTPGPSPKTHLIKLTYASRRTYELKTLIETVDKKAKEVKKDGGARK